MKRETLTILRDRVKLKIKYLNGSRLFYAFVAGGNAVIRDQDYLNKINVFPVPDADTGTNLASTFRAIVEGAKVHRSIKETLRSIANAALAGAQGNSGIIFAQFLHGMSAEVESDLFLTTHSFAESVRKAVRHAYEALLSPVEGTMLTVIRDWAEAVWERRHKTRDFEVLFSESLQAAQQSLEETPKKLPVLAKAGVVDAGAKGFVDFLEGILQFIKKGKIGTRLDAPEEGEGWNFDEVKTPARDKALHNRYCSEALLIGPSLDVDGVRAVVQRYGDSAAVAGSPERIRIHVHTNDPAGLFFELKDKGTISQIKADDMRLQHAAVYAPKSRIAIVTDSACDLPAESIDERQIHVLPLLLNFGGQQFLDKVTITPERFYELLKTSPVHPKTAQPPVRSLASLLAFVSSHYESVIMISISEKLTGVYQMGVKAAEKLAGKKVTVINSRTLSAGLGLIVARASDMALSGASHEEIVRGVESWAGKSRLLVDVRTLKYMVRGGRVSKTKGFIARLLNVKPIITLDAEGKAADAGKSFSRKGNMAKILRLVAAEAAKAPLWNYAVVHALAPDRAAAYGQKLTALLGKPPAYTMSVAPVIGVHSG
ncbi:MAG: DegV family EDD domain-containing protein, partial [Candidatus Aminicenantes bacterium]|nr:DegV family EDD domain-containing protein [Candidatus Aminicenantes bacterium]